MNYKVVTIFALLLQASTCSILAQSSKHVSSKELSQNVKQAQTAAQLHAAAEAYRSEGFKFRNDAQQENVELARRIEQTGGRTLKYPSPVDSARYLYQYDIAKADAMENEAQRIDALAASKR
jgi:hypothetical protein